MLNSVVECPLRRRVRLIPFLGHIFDFDTIRRFSVLLLASTISGCFFTVPCRAQTISGHIYGESSGLTNALVLQFVQGQSGTLLANGQSQAYLYDGQRFLPIGEAQGVRGSTAFKEMAVSPDGRWFIGVQGSRLMVARDVDRFAYQDLSFQTISASRNGQYPDFGSITAFQSGMVVMARTGLLYLDFSNRNGFPRLAALPSALTNATHILQNATTIFGEGLRLWGTQPDGRICAVGSGLSRCWGPDEGLPAEHWGGYALAPNGEVIARGVRDLVWLDPASPSVRRIMALPDPVENYDGWPDVLRCLVRHNGDIVTQDRLGVAILHEGHWRRVSLSSDGNVIGPLFLDRAGSLWMGSIGTGVLQFPSIDATESWTIASGLTSNMVWGIARDAHRVFIATDSGLEVKTDAGPPHPFVEPRSVQSITLDHAGRLWLDVNADTVERLDPDTGVRVSWPMPPISVLRVSDDGTVWAGTGRGLYRFATENGAVAPVLASPADLIVSSLSVDRDGTIWMTGEGKLWRRSADGAISVMVSQWPEAGAAPVAVVHQPSGPVWVGTYRNLFKVDVDQPLPVVSQVPADDLPSPAIMALLPRRDGSLWVGTGNGIAVLRDGRWQSFDTFDGLISGDISESALIEDPDGSVWVGTSRGLTHIIDPALMMGGPAPDLSILSAEVDGQRYRGAELPHRQARLSLMLGVLDNTLSGRMRFRARMQGIDPQWTELSSGTFVYPALPSGRHQLLVQAYDPLRHMGSAIRSITVAMDEPWWRRPWATLLAVLLLAILIWAVQRGRTLYLVRQRRLLSAQVSARTLELETRTHELEEARARLEVLAQRDALTGLLNRRAVRDRYVEVLAEAGQAMSVALIDVDHFKRINDTNGHLGGDAVLVEIARRYETALGGGEVIGRFGGEEYIVLIPGKPAEAAAVMRQATRHVVDRPVFFGARVIRFTVSGGIAPVIAGDSWEQVLERADRALYEAKRAGRDLIVEAGRMPIHRIPASPGLA